MFSGGSGGGGGGGGGAQGTPEVWGGVCATELVFDGGITAKNKRKKKYEENLVNPMRYL